MLNFINQIDQKLMTAVISSFVALIGIILTFIINKSQMNSQKRQILLREDELRLIKNKLEFEIKAKSDEIENIKKKILIDIDGMKNLLMKDIIVNRIEAYQDMWRIIIIYGINWELKKYEFNREWAKFFFDELNKNNEKYGLFYSQRVYEKFHELRTILFVILEIKDSRAADNIAIAKSSDVLLIIRGNYMPGLSTCLKDDLGSYIKLSVNA